MMPLEGLHVDVLPRQNATMLCDASTGSSTESARATLLQRGDASRGSSTESARATLLQRGGAVSLEVSRLKFELESRTSLLKTFQTTGRVARRRGPSSMLSFQLGEAPRWSEAVGHPTLKRGRVDVQPFQLSETF